MSLSKKEGVGDGRNLVPDRQVNGADTTHVSQSTDRSFADAVRQGAQETEQTRRFTPQRYNNSRGRFIKDQNSKIRCYRCGDLGHVASICRGAVKCFKCGSLGHRSVSCRSKFARTPLHTSALLPPHPSSSSSSSHPYSSLKTMDPLTEHANHRVIRFVANEASERLEAEATSGVILETTSWIHHSDLVAVLRVCFPAQGHRWSARFIGNHCFQVNAPEAWKKGVLAKGFRFSGRLQSMTLVKVVRWVQIR